MPIYEYECPECGAREEDEVAYARRDTRRPCWRCCGPTDTMPNMVRVPSVPNIAFKGDGWTPKFH